MLEEPYDLGESLPCPFCGLSESVVFEETKWGACVRCGGCDVFGPQGDSASEAIQLWNRRLSDAAPHAEALAELSKLRRLVARYKRERARDALAMTLDGDG